MIQPVFSHELEPIRSVCFDRAQQEDKMLGQMAASIHTMMDYPLTLTSIVERAERYFGDVDVISRLPDRSIHLSTWGRVAEKGRRLAESLCNAGLKKGDRVATLMWNHHIHLEVHFGVTVAGGVLHTLNMRLHPDEIAFIA